MLDLGKLSVGKRGRVFAVVLFLSATFAASSHAESEPRVEIQWTKAPGCPSGEWFLRRVEAFLGRSKEAAATRDLDVQVSVERDGARFVGEVRWENSDGAERRELGDPDCLVLADASAFVVASAIDPLVTYENAEPLAEVTLPEDPAEPDPVEQRALPIAEAQTPSESAVPRRSPRSEPARFAVGPRIEGRVGLLPEPALLMGATGEVTSGDVRGAASFTASLPREVELSSSARAGYFAIAATLEGCWLLLRGAVELPGCLVVEGAATRGQGRDVTDPETTWLPWVAIGAGSSIAAELGGDWAARFGANVGWVAVRPRFSFNGTPIDEAPAWDAALAVSLEWRFR